jgi:uncharacterized membrane protein YkvA (DUF1232 family)
MANGTKVAGAGDYGDYAGEFSEGKFWEKVKKYAKKAGEKVIYSALVLFYCFKDPETPIWAKTVILGALGYFISPVDAIPDIIPVLGFTDDMAVIASALAMVAMHIKKEHKEKAKERIEIWFG